MEEKKSINIELIEELKVPQQQCQVTDICKTSKPQQLETIVPSTSTYSHIITNKVLKNSATLLNSAKNFKLRFSTSEEQDFLKNKKEELDKDGEINEGFKSNLKDIRIREKYAAVKSMRSNEIQEALARECELSNVIIELNKRIEEMKKSHEYEREVHKRESFYLIKENECLKEQLRMIKKILEDKNISHDKEISQIKDKFCEIEKLLFEERQRTKDREAEQEKVIQNLCTSLCSTQTEIEIYIEQNKELNIVKKNLQDMTNKFFKAQGECSLWQEVLKRRELFLFLESEKLLELYSTLMQKMNNIRLSHEELYRIRVKNDVDYFINRMQEDFEMYDEMKFQLLEISKSSIEQNALTILYSFKSEEMLQLGQKHEALALELAQYLHNFELNQRNNVEKAAWYKALDDATMSYVLRQRDNEISDKMRTWKDALLEAHKLLHALLKRYEPFQKGDEVFVARVVECLTSAPHVREPVNVWIT